MYLRITTRCNMRCPHCCFACTSKGQDMSLKTFRKGLELAKDYDSWLTLGGGEPTLHPLFEQFLLEAIAASGELVTVITNGKIKHRALMIAALSRNGVIDGKLSQDEYHEPIDPKVIEAFVDMYHGPQSDSHLVIAGRAKDLLGYDRLPRKRDCPCEDIIINPGGIIHQCGCPRSPVIGHVNTGINTHFYGECYRSEAA